MKPDANSLVEAARKLFEAGDLPRAIGTLKEAARIEPGRVDVYLQIGSLEMMQGNAGAALANYQDALAQVPDSHDIHFHMGYAYQLQGDYKNALRCYRHALQLNTEDPKLHYYLGIVYRNLGEPEDAIDCFSEAVRLKPEFIEANTYLAGILLSSGCLDRAERHRQELLSRIDSFCAPDNNGDLSALLFLCPYLSLDESYTRRLAARFEQMFPERRITRSLPAPGVDGRIRIGYMSPSFKDHPVGHVTRSVFSCHDRSRFEVYLYATGKAPGPGDPYRQAISDSADHFVDISGFSTEAAAWRIAADGIHILVDLNGFMRDCRLQVLAHRPAPVQVFWLGYGGGLGVSYVDYVIADQVVLPAAHESRYREKIVRVPGIYHPADRAVISDRPLSRKSFGLRDDDFVFCVFNAPKKINREVFDSWMRILDRVPGSCLWLSNPEQSTLLVSNLREAARQFGIDPDRLVFSARIPDKSLHFARHRLADLFLDTFSYNASTTAIDALWAGLPILTRSGDTFCSRICADMLVNVGLEEMITHSTPEFEQRAVDLSRDPARLAEIRTRLQNNLGTSALFDVRQLVVHLETAYMHMWERCSAGLQPDHLDIQPGE